MFKLGDGLPLQFLEVSLVPLKRINKFASNLRPTRQDLGKTKRPEDPSLLQSEGISNRIPRKGHQLVSIVYLLLTADLMHPLRGG